MKLRRGEGDGRARTGLWHGVAWPGMVWRGMALQRVRGTTWPERRCKPRGFPFPLGLQAEAPDVAALERQRSFNPRPGIHVSHAPLLLKAPTQGQPWVCIGGGGTPGGVEARTRDHVHSVGRGLNQVTQCTRLESISGIQRRAGGEVEMKQPAMRKRGISTASGCQGLGLGKGAACSNMPGSNSCSIFQQSLLVIYCVPGEK